MEIITTMSGSVYEIDRAARRARRKKGNQASDLEQDGEWQNYVGIGPVIIGLPLIIVWRVTETAEGLLAPSTTTTPIMMSNQAN